MKADTAEKMHALCEELLKVDKDGLDNALSEIDREEPLTGFEGERLDDDDPLFISTIAALEIVIKLIQIAMKEKEQANA